mmetsp:Transcript_22244/g.46070  ORF Transcript_22244/g.46070 Transcript_22244/m.46070 type:complete len:218 (-) Transcript_22244:33-686(-)
MIVDRSLVNFSDLSCSSAKESFFNNTFGSPPSPFSTPSSVSENVLSNISLSIPLLHTLFPSFISDFSFLSSSWPSASFPLRCLFTIEQLAAPLLVLSCRRREVASALYCAAFFFHAITSDSKFDCRDVKYRSTDASAFMSLTRDIGGFGGGGGVGGGLFPSTKARSCRRVCRFLSSDEDAVEPRFFPREDTGLLVDSIGPVLSLSSSVSQRLPPCTC